MAHGMVIEPNSLEATQEKDEVKTVNDAAVRDPNQRHLKGLNDNAKANKGDLLTADDLPSVTVPPTFSEQLTTAIKGLQPPVSDDTSDIDADTGIRESILAGVRGEFQKGLADVQERAIGARRFRAGSTSAAELAVADAAKDRLISRLGDFELSARKDILAALGPLAAEEIRGETARDVATTGAEATTGAAQVSADAARDIADTKRRASISIANLNNSTELKIAFGYDQLDADGNPVLDEDGNPVKIPGHFDTEGRKIDNEEKKTTIQNIYASLAQIDALFQQQVDIAELTGIWEGVGSDVIAEFAFAMDKSMHEDPDFDPRFDINEDGRVDITDLRLLSADDEIGAIPTVAGRQLAIAEKTAEVDNYIKKVQSKLAVSSVLFDTEFKKAELLGLWQEYGEEEINDFTDTFGSVSGDDNYNARYDFDGNGNIDFSDFNQFTSWASAGIPTLTAKAFNEEASQFDLSQSADVEALDKQLNAMASEGKLNRQQQVNLTLAALQANMSLSAAKINSTHLANLLDFVVDADDALSDPDASTIITAAMNWGDLESVLDISDVARSKVERLVGTGGENPMTQETRELIDSGEFWTSLISAEPINTDDMTPEELNAHDAADIDGDGAITLEDHLDYLVITRGMDKDIEYIE